MDEFLNITKALSDGSRMRVVVALLRNEELCVCQIVELLQLATPTVSRHMSVLQTARLVQNRKDGRWVYYRLSSPFPQKLREWLEFLFNTEQIKADEVVLKNLLASTLEELCQNQKERKILHEFTK